MPFIVSLQTDLFAFLQEGKAKNQRSTRVIPPCIWTELHSYNGSEPLVYSITDLNQQYCPIRTERNAR